MKLLLRSSTPPTSTHALRLVSMSKRPARRSPSTTNWYRNHTIRFTETRFQDECYLHAESQYTKPENLIDGFMVDYFDKVRFTIELPFLHWAHLYLRSVTTFRICCTSLVLPAPRLHQQRRCHLHRQIPHRTHSPH